MRLRKCILALLAVFCAAQIHADVKVPAIISDNMVLQAEMPVNIWGKADPSEEVTVAFAGQTKTVKADAQGNWNIVLEPMKSNTESASLKITGKNSIEVKNVLVGEVWLGSGQSNMEWSASQTLNAKEETQAANYPLIRHFKVKVNISSSEQDDIEGQWTVCSPSTMPGYSAILYYFGRDLFKQMKQPVGLINSSLGATSIQPWLSQAVLDANPDYAKAVTVPKEKYSSLKVYNQYKDDTQRPCLNKDEGNRGEESGWHKTDCDTKDWKEVQSLMFAEKALNKNFDGAIWFRGELEMPADRQDKDFFIKFEPVTDAFTIYFNGEKVASGAQQLNIGWPSYKIPGKLVKAGKNILTIRFFNAFGNGAAGRVVFYDGPTDLKFSAKWFCKVEKEYPIANVPNLPAFRDLPGALYNAMIAPINPYTVRGTLWYQGEGNTWAPAIYAKMLQDLATSWRAAKKQPEMPVYVVQLANYMAVKNEPAESNWAHLRESQAKILEIPNTAIAVAIDVGEANNIHPANKQEVSRRLSLAARHFCYGEKALEYSGPLFSSASIEGSKIRIKFSHAKGLKSKDGGAVKGFAIAGEDKKFVWADAVIEGDSVLVSNPDLKNPAFVRYAWADNPVCNLYNSDNLPAVPFRTDK